MTAKLLHRPRDPSMRHLGRGERLGGAQDDQILEGEQPGLARPARGRYEAGLDQRANRAARKLQELLDLAHPILMDYFLAALRVAGSACWARLGGLRVSAFGFFSRLARNASIKSITWARLQALLLA